MTPEEIEAILQSNAKAIASNSNAIAESRREINSIYQVAADLARDRALMYEILRGLNEDRVTTLENLSAITENMANIAQTNVEINNVLGRIADALENKNQ